MGQTKPGVKYQSVSLAVPFIEEIKKHIQDKPGYRSIADFVREAVREKMQDEKRTIWSDDATRLGHKIKGKFTGKNTDQDEVIDVVTEKPIEDNESTIVLNSLKELIRNIIREEQMKSKK